MEARIILNKWSKIGQLLLGGGSLLMVIYAIALMTINFLIELGVPITIDLHALNITLASSTLGPQGWSWSGVITLITGLIGIYGFIDLRKNSQKNELLFIWGAYGIVLGIVGGTIGGGFIILAGVILITRYFLD